MAEDAQISERQGYRWLKSGKIKRVRDENGQLVFVLVGGPTDISDTDDTDMSATDVSTDTEPIPGLSTRGGRKLSVRPGSGPLVNQMKDELESSRIEFEIEKIQDARAKWQERKSREEKERAEQERIQRLEELQVREGQRQTGERERESRFIIQRVKESVLPLSAKAVLPASVMSAIYAEVEKTLSRMNLVGIPLSELVILGTDIKNRIIGANAEMVRQSAYEYLMAFSRNGLKETVKQMYNDYREHGGELSLRDFILANASSPDERETLLSLIAS